MKRENTFRLLQRARLFVFAGLAVIALLLSAGNARAGCVAIGKAGSAPTVFVSAHTALPAIQLRDEDRGDPANIVGLWHVIYTATQSTAGPLPVPVIPPGPPSSFEFAETMKTWHADGTEWEEKIEPAPAAFCFGVWKPTASGHVKLHHFGAVTGPDGSVVAIFYIDEINHVARDGRSYTGSWDMKIYDATDVFGTGPVLQEISGTLAATRITVD
ncbi:MAG: hypothetical protein ACRD1V_16700 [Vicinamibacterales bacterium]